MDKSAQYRQCVQTLLSRYASEDPEEEGVEIQLSFDTERDRVSFFKLS
ncbi:MAG: element excision factor XisI family protein [Cyanobacteriota bacterium]|nr:element excision factor XisI family protein [Cyanobacteriota bacterium]